MMNFTCAIIEKYLSEQQLCLHDFPLFYYEHIKMKKCFGTVLFNANDKRKPTINLTKK